LPPIIYGDGTQTRDFIHVQDVVNAMKIVAKNPKTFGETLNVATGIPATINQLAQLIMQLGDTKKLKPKYRPARKGDLKHSCASIEKARNVLGFEPKITLKHGLLDLVK
jgi:nucleoside-diphosphate-sugar epimerase